MINGENFNLHRLLDQSLLGGCNQLHHHLSALEMKDGIPDVLDVQGMRKGISDVEEVHCHPVDFAD